MRRNPKVVHVLKEARKGAGDHHCHWPGCDRAVPPSMWGCKYHWRLIPIHLQRKIWAAYSPGQEISKTPSRSYIDVAREVQEWIRNNFPPTARGMEYDL